MAAAITVSRLSRPGLGWAMYGLLSKSLFCPPLRHPVILISHYHPPSSRRMIPRFDRYLLLYHLITSSPQPSNSQRPLYRPLQLPLHPLPDLLRPPLYRCNLNADLPTGGCLTSTPSSSAPIRPIPPIPHPHPILFPVLSLRLWRWMWRFHGHRSTHLLNNLFTGQHLVLSPPAIISGLHSHCSSSTSGHSRRSRGSGSLRRRPVWMSVLRW